MPAERVALMPECVECEIPWLPADESAGTPTSPDDEPPELAFFCPECADREFGTT
jgi:hypothetical protein